MRAKGSHRCEGQHFSKYPSVEMFGSSLVVGVLLMQGTSTAEMCRNVTMNMFSRRRFTVQCARCTEGEDEAEGSRGMQVKGW
jgi:hypothetical protein